MEFAKLRLYNYRNFAEKDYSFSPAGALIQGKNGIGKSNLLEAISYFAFGKSVRNNKDLDLINFSKAFFRIEGEFYIGKKLHLISAAADKQKKVIKLDNVKISRISELYQYLKVVYCSPDDINIISGAPRCRRNFIDQAISQYSYAYIEMMRSYNHLIKQRNALLKSDFNKQEKKSWDLQFAFLSAKIIKQRELYLEKFTPLLIKNYARISGDQEIVKISYAHSFPYQDQDYKTEMLAHIRTLEKQEKHFERTLCGPHLDDITFLMNDHPVRTFGSQGQKRSLAIAVRLVQAKLISEDKAEYPILIFDDVLADLDKQRSTGILNILTDRHQIFIASPDPAVYKDFNLQMIDLEKSS